MQNTINDEQLQKAIEDVQAALKKARQRNDAVRLIDEDLNATIETESLEYLISAALRTKQAEKERDEWKTSYDRTQSAYDKLVNEYYPLKQEREQLKSALAQCAKALKNHHGHDSQECEVAFIQCGQPMAIITDLGEAYSESALAEETAKALALPIVQASLKEK